MVSRYINRVFALAAFDILLSVSVEVMYVKREPDCV